MVDRSARHRIAAAAAAVSTTTRILMLAVAVRVTYLAVGVERPETQLYDWAYFRGAAAGLATGKGFVQPVMYSPVVLTANEPSAEHPPLYTLLLTPISWVTDNNDFALRWLGIVTGTLTVLVVMLLARRVAGERAGTLAGVLAAVYPNLWVHDALIMSESLAALLVALVLLVAVRELQSPRARAGAAWLGGLCGLAALTRGELIMLLPFIALPVAWSTRRPIVDRLRSAGFVLGCFAIVVGPWVVYNLSRFEEPVFISSNFDLNLRGSSCPESLTSVQRGALGFCVYLDPATGADESVRAKEYRAEALDDIREHLDEYPLTVAARIGRTWSVYAPGFELDVGYAEGRPRLVSLAGIAALWLGFPLLVLGFARIADRRLRALLGVPIVITLLPMLVSYGQMRYRIAAEPVIVVVVAIGIASLLERIGRIGRATSPTIVAPSDGSAEAAPQPTGWARLSRSNLPTYFGLAGLAIAQPVLNFFDRNPRVVADSAVGGPGLLFVVLLVLIVPPLGMWAFEVVAQRIARVPVLVSGGVAVGVVVALAVLVSTPVDFGPPFAIECALAVAVGVAGGIGWARVASVRQWTRFFGVFPLILAVQFLLVTPPVSWSGTEPGAASSVTAEAPVDVVLVVFDQLPLDGLLDGKGRVDSELFPHFANLADRSTWYRNTTTVAPNTEVAVPALLTGVIPTEPDRPPTADDYPRNVFAALQSQYRVNAWETVTSLCEGACGGPTRANDGGGVTQLLRDGIGAWNDALLARSDSAARDDFLSGDWASGPPPATRVRQFVRSLDSDDRPNLDYLHVMLPHHPWRYSADGTQYAPGFDVEGLGLDLRWQSDAAANASRQRQLLQTQYADLALGQILDRLRQDSSSGSSGWDDKLVIVTADHGAAFAQNEPLRGVSGTNVESIAWVPLVVKYPGQVVGETTDRPSLTIDVMPTIFDVLEVGDAGDSMAALDGVSLRDEPADRSTIELLDWNQSVVHPARGTRSSFEREPGFAAVLQSQAWERWQSPDPYRSFRIGPHGDLVGLEVVAASLVGRSQYGWSPGARDPDEPFVRASTDVAVGRWILVAVDGVGVGVGTPLDTKQSAARLAISLVPELVAGSEGSLVAYEIIDDGGLIRLAPLVAR